MAIELVTLELELPLLSEPLALRIELVLRVRRGRQASPQRFLPYTLLLLEQLRLKALFELQRFYALRVGGSEVGRAPAHVLLQVQVQRVLLLLELEMPMLEIRVGSMYERDVQQCGCADANVRADRVYRPSLSHESGLVRL